MSAGSAVIDRSQYPHVVPFEDRYRQMLRDLGRGVWQRGEPDSPVVTSSETPLIKVIDVAVIKPGGTISHEQILVAEEGGAAMVFYDPDTKSIGLRKQWRYQHPDPQRWAAAMREGDDAVLALLDELGMVSYEVVRGFPKKQDVTVADTAKREGREEGERDVIEMRQLVTFCCSNTSLNPHRAAVFVGKVHRDRTGGDRPDPDEVFLGGLEWFTGPQVRQLIDSGELYCLYTLGAILLLLNDDPNALEGFGA